MKKFSTFTSVKGAHSFECLTSCKNIQEPTERRMRPKSRWVLAFYGLLLIQGRLMVQVSVPLRGLSCQLTDYVQTVNRDIKTSSDYIAITSEGAEVKSRRYEDLTETIAINPLNFHLGVRGAHSVLTSLLQ